MQQKIGDCIECPRTNVPINSKGLCPDCVYKRNHDGMSRFEVTKSKEKGKNDKLYSLKRKPIKTTKKRKKKNVFLKNERLEKRRRQIEKDEKTYEEVFNSKPNFCEECGKPLPDELRDEEEQIIFRTQYSHIMTKAAYPEFRNDSRNFNRLCDVHHDQWEFHDRENMKIYRQNQKIIEQLLKERHEKK